MRWKKHIQGFVLSLIVVFVYIRNQRLHVIDDEELLRESKNENEPKCGNHYTLKQRGEHSGSLFLYHLLDSPRVLNTLHHSSDTMSNLFQKLPIPELKLFHNISWHHFPEPFKTRKDPWIMMLRILGNDLPPRHNPEQTLMNLKFTLIHEPSHPLILKGWILNRIMDPQKLNILVQLLEDHQQFYAIIPMFPQVYNNIPYSFHSSSLLSALNMKHSGGFHGLDFFHDPRFFKASNRIANYALDRLYHEKNLYVIHNNGCRNAALALGKSLGAEWTMPLDGNGFMTKEAQDFLVNDLNSFGKRSNPIDMETKSEYPEFKDSFKSSNVQYFIMPMVRILNNTDLLNSTRSDSFKAMAIDEPQILFRQDAPLHYAPYLRYGRRPKLDLLWRLGVPKNENFQKVFPWEEQEAILDPNLAILLKDSLSTSVFPTIYRPTSWIARLFSGSSAQESSHDPNSRNKRSLSRLAGIHEFIDALDESLYKNHLDFGFKDGLLCYNRNMLQTSSYYDYRTVMDYLAVIPADKYLYRNDWWSVIFRKFCKSAHHVNSARHRLLLLHSPETLNINYDPNETFCIHHICKDLIAASIMAHFHSQDYRKTAVHILQGLLTHPRLANLLQFLSSLDNSTFHELFGQFNVEDSLLPVTTESFIGTFPMNMKWINTPWNDEFIFILMNIPLELLTDSITLLRTTNKADVAESCEISKDTELKAVMEKYDVLFLYMELWMKSSPFSIGAVTSFNMTMLDPLLVTDLHHPWKSSLPIYTSPLNGRHDRNLQWDIQMLAVYKYNQNIQGFMKLLKMSLQRCNRIYAKNKSSCYLTDPGVPNYPIKLTRRQNVTITHSDEEERYRTHPLSSLYLYENGLILPMNCTFATANVDYHFDTYMHHCEVESTSKRAIHDDFLVWKQLFYPTPQNDTFHKDVLLVTLENLCVLERISRNMGIVGEFSLYEQLWTFSVDGHSMKDILDFYLDRNNSTLITTPTHPYHHHLCKLDVQSETEEMLAIMAYMTEDISTNVTIKQGKGKIPFWHFAWTSPNPS